MSGASRSDQVPAPTTLLAIQAGGGALALLPLLSFRKIANLTPGLYELLLTSALLNVVASTVILLGVLAKMPFFLRQIARVGELGLCRAIIVVDMFMLGSLVYLTGGPDASIFAPQAAAVLPIAVLIRDVPAVKWTYAAIFILIYLAGSMSDPPAAFSGYKSAGETKQWLLIFFFIFTLFPVIYSIQMERKPRD